MTTITRFFFKTDEEYRKACDTLDKAIKEIQTGHLTMVKMPRIKNCG